VLFDPAMATEFAFVHKRGAQLFSKSRFVAAQFDAYFRDGLWLETARHSNSMAKRIAAAIRASKSGRLAWQPEANEVFAIISRDLEKTLRAKGASFHEWRAPHGYAGEIAGDEILVRFVASFATTADDVARLGELLGWMTA
jgi:threonine aldolase